MKRSGKRAAPSRSSSHDHRTHQRQQLQVPGGSHQGGADQRHHKNNKAAALPLWEIEENYNGLQHPPIQQRQDLQKQTRFYSKGQKTVELCGHKHKIYGYHILANAKATLGMGWGSLYRNFGEMVRSGGAERRRWITHPLEASMVCPQPEGGAVMWNVTESWGCHTSSTHTIRAAPCVLIKLRVYPEPKKLRSQQNTDKRLRLCAWTCKHARRSGTGAHLSTVLSDSAADTCGEKMVLKSIQL